MPGSQQWKLIASWEPLAGTQERLRHLLAAWENCLGEAAHSHVNTLAIKLQWSREQEAQWFEIQEAWKTRSSLKVSGWSQLGSHCCAAAHVASGPGLSLKTTPAFATPESDNDSAGSRPDVLIRLLLGVWFHSQPGSSSQPVASWPWLELRPPQVPGFLCCFLSSPQGLASCQATWPSGREAYWASWLVLCPTELGRDVTIPGFTAKGSSSPL